MNIIIYDDVVVEPENGSGICALCDNAVEDASEPAIIRRHGGFYIAHAMCCEDADETP